MTMHVRDAGTWKSVTGLSVRDAGTWKSVTAGFVKDGGTWKQFYGGGGGGGGGGLTVSLSASSLSASRSGAASSGTVWSATSQVPTITVSGATGAVTYSWSRISSPSIFGAFGVSGNTTATPRWNVTAIDSEPGEETWRLTVTDSVSATGTADLLVSLAWYDNR